MFRSILLLLSLCALLAAQEGGPSPVTPAPAPAPAGSQGGGLWSMVIFLVVMVLMMWFLIIRPQRKEEKRRREMLEALKRGDEVVTIGGVHGVIEAVGEQTIDLRIGKGAQTLVVTFNKGAISANLTAERASKA
ncbi:MAG: preprotein translocase subunit YajC [Planctomycetota bacterium]|nr:preprotein translocase subunit YajC [Planctomycetota bacterium]MCX8040031.1 preprotein translocase subunit YajC [Planctomycetota bacterium]MDW8372597.1 preprotein translocase subunit YajC [Planctomycetota bacterium]